MRPPNMTLQHSLREHFYDIRVNHHLLAHVQGATNCETIRRPKPSRAIAMPQADPRGSLGIERWSPQIPPVPRLKIDRPRRPTVGRRSASGGLDGQQILTARVSLNKGRNIEGSAGAQHGHDFRYCRRARPSWPRPGGAKTGMV